ncbi:MAG: ParB/RepB/Spo0J family partition protein [Bacillota bacterium]
MTRKSLGRGIDALIPSMNEPPGDDVIRVNPNAITADPNQPRQTFDEVKIDELAASLKEHGVIQPLIVRRVGSGYQLVAGERRLRAAIRAGLREVPVVVREMDDREAMEVSLVENLQREDLGPIEQAGAFQRLVEEFGLTQEQVAKRVGKSRSDVANTLRLLNLEPEVKALVSEGKISGGHGRALLGLEREAQIKMARTIVSRGLSVRRTEEAVANEGRRATPRRQRPVGARRKDAEEILTAALGSPVIVRSQGSKGTIEISFYGEEDLERLVEIIQRGPQSETF